MENQNASIERLLEIMARLRDPKSGCPWDVEQTFATIAPYTIEEAYEVADAIARNATDELKDELGDLLLQVVFHAQMAREKGLFDFDDIVNAISDKMVRRHPNVFAGASIEDADAQTRAWEEQKAREREEKARKAGRTPSALDGVAMGLPALMRAEKLQKRASRVGFDWPELDGVIAKIREELDEVEAVLAAGENEHRKREEVGDLLFACTNLARFLKVEAEDALLAANAKFERRFRRIEALLEKEGKSTADSTLSEMERLWLQAKHEEKSSEYV